MNSSLYYLAITEEYVKTQVHNLDRVSTLQGRNLPLDRFYTSLKLAEWLWEKITLVGTRHTMRKGVVKVSSLFDWEPLILKVLW